MCVHDEKFPLPIPSHDDALPGEGRLALRPPSRVKVRLASELQISLDAGGGWPRRASFDEQNGRCACSLTVDMISADAALEYYGLLNAVVSPCLLECYETYKLARKILGQKRTSR
jgi:hypothetical protein